MGAALLDLFHDDGIEVLLETHVRQVEGRSGRAVLVNLENKKDRRTVEGTDILVATGRTPNTDGLGLEKTGVQLDAHGYIRVNEQLLTTSENIWAMGDCAGSPQFTHVSVDDFLIVNGNLKGAKRTKSKSVDSVLHVHRPRAGAGWKKRGRGAA